MKKILLLTPVLFLLLSQMNGQTIWIGSKMTFTKNNGADVSLEASQDRLTDNVWLTRASAGGGGIYNIKLETGFVESSSPSGAEWAYGKTADGVNTLTFGTMFQANQAISSRGNSPALNRDMVLHLTTSNIYIDIKFLSWTGGRNGGGGFSYERSTNQNLSVEDLNTPNRNLSLIYLENKNIRIKGIQQLEYSLANIAGQKVKQSIIDSEGVISLQGLEVGVYILSVKGYSAVKIIRS